LVPGFTIAAPLPHSSVCTIARPPVAIGNWASNATRWASTPASSAGSQASTSTQTKHEGEAKLGLRVAERGSARAVARDGLWKNTALAKGADQLRVQLQVAF
jgi:hypothetical protein